VARGLKIGFNCPRTFASLKGTEIAGGDGDSPCDIKRNISPRRCAWQQKNLPLDSIK
jgi:hypothetical protein